jgi:hypothetical protein
MVCCHASQSIVGRNQEGTHMTPKRTVKTISVPRQTLVDIRDVIRHVASTDPWIQQKVIDAEETLSNLLSKKD